MNAIKKYECIGGPLDGEVVEPDTAFNLKEESGASGHYQLCSVTLFLDSGTVYEYSFRWIYAT